MATAFLFPGQGAQTPDAAPLVREHAPDLLETCIAALGEDPLPRCDESAAFAQPAIVLMRSLVGMGIERFVDAGPGTVLERLVARNLEGVTDAVSAGT